MGLIYALTFYAVTVWNALPDEIHYARTFWPWLKFAALLGYRVYEDGSIGW
jgi:hypothetical protein